MTFRLRLSVVLFAIVALWAGPGGMAAGQDPVFSGPQPGEKLAGFSIRGVLGDRAGKMWDPVAEAGGKPLVIVFVHETTRPSISLTRMLMTYVARRRSDGLRGTVIFLGSDATEREAFVKRARNALPTDVPLGVSPDGSEGPGNYGLNRHVTLTVLVAQDNVVKANFALVQPSVQSDLPKVLAAIVDVVGGKVPSLEELGLAREQQKAQDRPIAATDPQLMTLVRQLIQKSAKDEDVVRISEQIEKRVAERPASKRILGEIAQRIVRAGVVENYGTPPAQDQLRAWAKKYGPAVPNEANKEQGSEKKPDSDRVRSKDKAPSGNLRDARRAM